MAGRYPGVEDDRNELYHLGRDVSEMHDLTTEQPDRVRAMAAELQSWQRSVGARLPSRNPDYDPVAAARAARRLEKEGLPKREREHAAFLDPDFVPNGGWWQERGSPKK